MATTIESAVVIEAPAEKVWDLLTDFNSFPAWNPFIRSAQGALVPGADLNIRLRLVDGRSVRLRPRITRVDPGRELRWRARLVAPGVLDVDRRFAFEPLGPSSVRFMQSETCTGLLAPLLRLGMDARILRGYRELEQAIKARAEGEGRGARSAIG